MRARSTGSQRKTVRGNRPVCVSSSQSIHAGRSPESAQNPAREVLPLPGVVWKYGWVVYPHRPETRLGRAAAKARTNGHAGGVWRGVLLGSHNHGMADSRLFCARRFRYGPSGVAGKHSVPLMIDSGTAIRSEEHT